MPTDDQNGKPQDGYPRRRSTRLREYDYSKNGAYFVTICTYAREHSFGEIRNGILMETETSRICQSCWDDLPNHYPNCTLDAFVIMPNHVHGIIVLDDPVGVGLKPTPTKNHKHHPLSEIIRGFKTFTARRINAHQKTEGIPFWQRNYYERIIRNEEELGQIREYIMRNPENWEHDKNNPKNVYL